MYQVNYYLNGKHLTYNFEFHTIAGAIYKACAIFTEHGICSDVMDTTTGEILAIFSYDDIYIAQGIFNLSEI